MLRPPSTVLALGVLCLACLTPARAQVSYAIRDLGNPAGGGSRATGINNWGQVVGTYQDLNGGTTHAFTWEAVNGLTTLSGMTGSSAATGINDSAAVVGRDSNGPFLWTTGGGRRTFHNFDGLSAGASGVNNAGTVAGTYYPNTNIAYTWDPGAGFRPLGTLANSTYRVAHAINDAGQVAGRSRNGNAHDRAALWDPATGWRDLGAIYASSEAFALNDRGQVVGDSYTGNGNHAFLWDAAGGLRDLGTLTGGESHAYGVNDRGEVVGEASFKAFVWRDGQMRDLNALIDPTLGWNLRSATAVNDIGQIVGYGTVGGDPFMHAYLLTPVPEPSAAWWASSALALAACGACRPGWFRRTPAAPDRGGIS